MGNLEQVGSVHAAGLLGHAHAHEASHGTGGIGRGGHFGGGIGTDHVGSCTAGIHKGCVALHFLDHGLVFLGGLQAGNAEGNDLQTPEVTPLAAEHFIQRFGDLVGVAGQGAVADAHGGDLGECGTQCCQKLGLQHGVQTVTGVVLGDIGAYILVEQHGVTDPVGIFTEAADGDIEIDGCPLIHHPEGHGAGGAVLVAHQFLGIEVVNSLILGGLTAEGEALTHGGKGLADAVTQIACEDGRLGGSIICIFAGLCTEFCDSALIHDHHTLTLIDHDDRTVGDDIVGATGIGGTAACLLHALGCQHILRQRITNKEFLPLIGQYAACGTQCCFNKTHISFSFQILVYCNHCYLQNMVVSNQVYSINYSIFTSFVTLNNGRFDGNGKNISHIRTFFHHRKKGPRRSGVPKGVKLVGGNDPNDIRPHLVVTIIIDQALIAVLA